MTFLKKPKRRSTSKGGGATSCPALTSKKPDPLAKQVSVPPQKGWLHMDVLEREKLEWTTDVPSTSSKPEMDNVESRFSLDGIVIPRSEDVPFHLGLHHHGDEAEVRKG